ncbi:MAG: hypothetical protein QM778_20970 [Myxococcales bacterium]
MTQVIIRDFHPSDRDSVRKVCFETGMMGDPIVDQYRDFDSFVDMFTAYYTDEEPENSVVAELDGQVVGYMLCALDVRRAKTPARYMLKHAFTRGACFRPGTFGFYMRSAFDMLGDLVGDNAPKVDYDLYPSAPHINLLGSARRGGGATEMFYRVFDHIVARGSKGMHGSVQATNRPIIDLAMKKLGFHLVGDPFPVPGLRDGKGERVALQTLARTLTDWDVGAWKRRGFRMNTSPPRA